VPLDAGNDAEIRLSAFGAGLTKAVIIVAAATEGTSEPANYQYSLTTSAPSDRPWCGIRSPEPNPSWEARSAGCFTSFSMPETKH